MSFRAQRCGRADPGGFFPVAAAQVQGAVEVLSFLADLRPAYSNADAAPAGADGLVDAVVTRRWRPLVRLAALADGVVDESNARTVSSPLVGLGASGAHRSRSHVCSAAYRGQTAWCAGSCATEFGTAASISLIGIPAHPYRTLAPIHFRGLRRPHRRRVAAEHPKAAHRRCADVRQLGPDRRGLAQPPLVASSITLASAGSARANSRVDPGSSLDDQGRKHERSFARCGTASPHGNVERMLIPCRRERRHTAGSNRLQGVRARGCRRPAPLVHTRWPSGLTSRPRWSLPNPTWRPTRPPVSHEVQVGAETATTTRGAVAEFNATYSRWHRGSTCRCPVASIANDVLIVIRWVKRRTKNEPRLAVPKLSRYITG